MHQVAYIIIRKLTISIASLGEFFSPQFSFLCQFRVMALDLN